LADTSAHCNINLRFIAGDPTVQHPMSKRSEMSKSQ